MPELKSRVKGILFLGTPHRGTPFTRFGIFAAGVLAPLDADIHIMRLLVPDSVDLDDLEKRFSKHFHSTKRMYYFERHKIYRHLLGFIPWVREFVCDFSTLRTHCRADLQCRSSQNSLRRLVQTPPRE